MNLIRNRVFEALGSRPAPAIMLTVVLFAAAAAAFAVVSGRSESQGPSEPHLDEPVLPAAPRVLPLEGPWVVAVQPGHWRIDELPAEHARRRANFGASHLGVREVDINVAVVDALVPLLEDEGWTVAVVPATVPPGMRADAFLSIHADWGGDPNRRGWKLAAPWRPSPAASSLAQSLRSSFAAEPSLREDVGGITVGMRGYFGFASHRFHHASSPYTPAVLVELGFLTNDSERTRLANEPDYYAAIIHRGLSDYFADRDRADTASLIPREFGIMAAGESGATVRRGASPTSAALRELPPGEPVRPVDELDGWYEVRLRSPSLTGWVRVEELVVFGTRAATAPTEEHDESS